MRGVGTFALLLLLAGAIANSQAAALRVDGKAIADAAGTEWLSHGRTYDEQRFSPLTAINAGNVSRLGLAWYADVEPDGAQEGTPLVIDGTIYIGTAWSRAKAYDAVSGKLLWSYDPQVPRETQIKACCTVATRGLAAWGDKLFLATLDGRLIALDRATGKPLWSVVTVDQTKNYTITGAPRVVNGLVVIGNGGADLFGVRGYVTAYDAATGKQAWRFYTVPDQPGKNKEPYLKAAEATWASDWWMRGGGGTVWDAMAYDPDLDLLYIGVGNGSSWNAAYRAPGGGDNLYVSSIVAIRAKTGAYVWHFQQVPGETWDYTASQTIILADLVIGGKARKALLHAPKNGFFYVIDRVTGQFISGNNFVPVNWAKALDPKTGRPIENPDARFDKTGKPFMAMPSSQGAHNWQPMAYDAGARLAFIPGQVTAFPFVPVKDWRTAVIGFDFGVDFSAIANPAVVGPLMTPDVAEAMAKSGGSFLLAWDPVAQKEVWRIRNPQGFGGLLATAGGLVFGGNGASLVATATQDGKPLWSFPAQTGIAAGPVTFMAGGTQYVAVLAGSGVREPAPPQAAAANSPRNIPRLLVFKLDGTAKLPAPPPYRVAQLPAALPSEPPPPERLAQGKYAWFNHCTFCHNGAMAPDLRFSTVLPDPRAWKAVVHDGALARRGMAGWSQVFSPDEVESIRAYMIGEAQAYKAQSERAAAAPPRAP
jgi:quinohemoprotein ethanol dehydrogenase